MLSVWTLLCILCLSSSFSPPESVLCFFYYVEIPSWPIGGSSWPEDERSKCCTLQIQYSCIVGELYSSRVQPPSHLSCVIHVLSKYWVQWTSWCIPGISPKTLSPISCFHESFSAEWGCEKLRFTSSAIISLFSSAVTLPVSCTVRVFTPKG